MSSILFSSILTETEVRNCKHLLNRHSCHVNSCCLWLSTKDKDGYGVVRFLFRGKRLKVKVHRLAYYLENNFVRMTGKQVSHLCHTKNCFQSSHLSLETSNVNNKRKVCVSNGECTGHYGYKRCIIR